MSIPGETQSLHLLTAFSRSLFAELLALDIDTWVISPGSRSTPFVLALKHLQQKKSVELHSVLDERAAAFFALGMAKGRSERHGVGLICTSGSAAAHYLPAVIEASQAYIPLTLITADRPQRLQNCASPQTIPQQGLYGSFVRKSLNIKPELCLADAERSFRAVAQAVELGRGKTSGPVHINVEADKPLEEYEPKTERDRLFYLALKDSALLAAQKALPQDSSPGFRPKAEALELQKTMASVGMLVSVGPLKQSLREGLKSWAAQQSLPFIDELPGAAAGSFEFLSKASASKNWPADGRILHFGPPPVTTTGQQFLEQHAAKLLIRSHAAPGDFTTKAFDSNFGDLEALAQCLLEASTLGKESSSTLALQQTRHELEQALERGRKELSRWLQTDPIVEKKLGKAGEKNDPKPSQPQTNNHEPHKLCLSEQQVGALVLESMSKVSSQGMNLMLANSLSVRLACWVAPAFSLRQESQIFTQRGANGIEGSFATAAGLSLASNRPTLLLCGDVAAAHDLSSLSLLKRAKSPLVALILDNDGGRIFDHLPLSHERQNTDIWPFFQTQPQVNFRAAAETFDLNYLGVSTAEQLRDALTQTLSKTMKTATATIIHARVIGGSSKEFVRTLQVKASSSPDE